MSKFKKLLFVVFISILLISFWGKVSVAAQPMGEGLKAPFVAGDTVKLRVNNQTESVVRITLTGPRNYYLSAPIGVSKHEVQPGSYTYSYLAYGVEQTGDIDIFKDGVQLKIASQAVRVRINNKTGVPITLNLQGPQTKNIALSPGSTKLEVWKGNYTYSFTAYGQYKTGSISFLNNGAELVLERMTTNLKIDNKTGAEILLSLQGPRFYNISLPPGATKQEILRGNYKFSYLDYGYQETGELSAQENNVSLTLAKTVATLKVVNRTNSDVNLRLQGPRSYFLSSPVGTSKHQVRMGGYEYKYYACGAWQEGNHEVKKNTELKLPACGAAKSGGVKVIIANNTNGTITIHLSGPEEYWFTIPSGTETIQVSKGTYEYTVWGCGSSMTGSQSFKSKTKWRFWCE